MVYSGKYHWILDDDWEILVGGIPTPLKNDGVKVSWDEIPIWKVIKAMFQTTNQNMMLCQIWCKALEHAYFFVSPQWCSGNWLVIVEVRGATSNICCAPWKPFLPYVMEAMGTDQSVFGIAITEISHEFLKQFYQMLHGAGIFTYMTGWFWGQMLVNIPYMEHLGSGFSARFLVSFFPSCAALKMQFLIFCTVWDATGGLEPVRNPGMSHQVLTIVMNLA